MAVPCCFRKHFVYNCVFTTLTVVTLYHFLFVSIDWEKEHTDAIAEEWNKMVAGETPDLDRLKNLPAPNITYTVPGNPFYSMLPDRNWDESKQDDDDFDGLNDDFPDHAATSSSNATNNSTPNLRGSTLDNGNSAVEQAATTEANDHTHLDYEWDPIDEDEEEYATPPEKDTWSEPQPVTPPQEWKQDSEGQESWSQPDNQQVEWNQQGQQEQSANMAAETTAEEGTWSQPDQPQGDWTKEGDQQHTENAAGESVPNQEATEGEWKQESEQEGNSDNGEQPTGGTQAEAPSEGEWKQENAVESTGVQESWSQPESQGTEGGETMDSNANPEGGEQNTAWQEADSNTEAVN